MTEVEKLQQEVEQLRKEVNLRIRYCSYLHCCCMCGESRNISDYEDFKKQYSQTIFAND